MPCACTLYFVVKTQNNILANWCSIKVFVSRNFPWKWLLWKVFKITCFKDVRSPAHYWLIWVFFTKNGAENSSYILALFFIKTDLINKGQKGGHPIYCYYPFWGHLELEFFDDFWLKAQKLLMELCMKIKMRKSLYQFHSKQNASSGDKHSTKPWCLREVGKYKIVLPLK